MTDRASRLLPFPAAAVAAVMITFSAGCPGGGGDDAGTDGGVDAGPQVPDPEIITPNEQGWWRDDVFYEVFVRSFFDSNGDGKGDLAGLTAKLDYLNDGDPFSATDLGIDGIWTMPIFESPSYHGYDIVDYRKVDGEYGTDADFDAFIAAAHARGIKVILDLVINHTSANHPWFQSARQGPDAEYRDFYVWRNARPEGDDWDRPWESGAITWHFVNGAYYYGIYNSGMPDLNWRNPEVEAEFVAIMKYWLARGVDGFRVDAVRYLVETSVAEDEKNEGAPILADHPLTHEVIQRLRHAVHQEYPQALFVAEAWTSAQRVKDYYGEGNEFQLAFAFDISDAIRASLNNGTANAIHQANGQSQSLFTDRGFEAPFLTNHDQPRTMRQLTKANTPVFDKAKAAAALLMAHPGTPFLYYGEEIGMMGGPQSFSRDEDKRTPMVWDASQPKRGFSSAATTWYEAVSTGDAPEEPSVDVALQRADPDSLWSLYRDLIALRKTDPALTSAFAARPVITGGNGAAFALVRTGESGGRLLFVVNLAGTNTGAFTVSVSGAPAPVLTEGSFTAPTSDGSALSFTDLPPYAFGFFRLD